MLQMRISKLQRALKLIKSYRNHEDANKKKMIKNLLKIKAILIAKLGHMLDEFLGLEQDKISIVLTGLQNSSFEQ